MAATAPRDPRRAHAARRGARALPGLGRRPHAPPRSSPRSARRPRRSAGAELERQAARLEALGPEARELVETVSRRVVAKLLHEPSVQVKRRGRVASRRAPRRGAARAVRPLTAARASPFGSRPRSSPLALHQAADSSPTSLIAAGAGGHDRAGRGRARHGRDDRRPAPRRADRRARRPRRVREGGGAGGPRRSGRLRRPLGEGPAVERRATVASSSPRPRRGDARDALVGRPLDDLGPGAVDRDRVRPPPGTARLGPAGSPLRRAAGQHRHPARRKVPDGGAVVVAMAALERLGLVELAPRCCRPRSCSPRSARAPSPCVPAPGTTRRIGAARARRRRARAPLRCGRAGVPAALGGGCDAPVGAHADVAHWPDGALRLEGLLASGDGSSCSGGAAVGEDPEQLGAGLAASCSSSGAAGAARRRARRR